MRRIRGIADGAYVRKKEIIHANFETFDEPHIMISASVVYQSYPIFEFVDTDIKGSVKLWSRASMEVS